MQEAVLEAIKTMNLNKETQDWRSENKAADSGRAERGLITKLLIGTLVSSNLSLHPFLF